MLKDGFCYLRIFSNNHRWHIATRLGTNPTIDHVLSLNTSWRRHDSFINCLLSGPFRAHISRSRRANPWLAQLHSLGGSLPVTVGSNHVPKLDWKEIAMDLEQQLDIARIAVEQLTARLIPTKKHIPETPKELVQLLRQIDQYQRPRPQTTTTASGASDVQPRQQPRPQNMITASGVSTARCRQVLQPMTSTPTSGVSDARPRQLPRPMTMSPASGVSDARPRQVPRPMTMTPASGVSDTRPRLQP